jgi:hypothetical protein
MSYIGFPQTIKQVSNINLEGEFVRIPEGTSAQRDNNIPNPQSGMFRFNTSDNSFEGYDGSSWGSIGGSNSVSYTTLDSTVHTINFSVLPFYLSNGNFSPICLRAGIIPFMLADGVTEIEYKVN